MRPRGRGGAQLCDTRSIVLTSLTLPHTDFIIREGKTITNEGTITNNNGKITKSNGTITNYGIINNYSGEISNNGTIDEKHGSLIMDDNQQ